jgi:haloalkane dehalogenase
MTDRKFIHHKDMEPADLVKKLDRTPSDEFPYEHKFIEVLGDQMAYVETGKLDSDQTILFVHGAPESAYIWRNVMPYMERYARVIAPEHIGHGLSDKPDTEYTIENYYKHLEAFIEKKGLKNLTIVCQDWGSVIGPLYGANHPDNVQGVVLMEALIMPSYPITNSKEARNDPTMAIAMKHYDDWRADEAVSGNYEQNWFVERDMMKHTVRKLNQRVMDTYRDPFRDPKWRDPVIMWPRECGFDGDRPFPDSAMTKINEWLLSDKQVKVLDLFTKPGAVTTQVEVAWRAAHIENHESNFVGIGNHFLQEDCAESIGHAIADWFRRNLAKDKKQWYFESPRNELETILHFAGAVMKGNMELAMSMIHPEVTWKYAGDKEAVPFAGEYKGREGVMQFLGMFNEECEIIEFEPDLIWDEDKIILRVEEINKSRKTGKQGTISVTQVYKIRYGQIIEFQEYADTSTMATLLKA